VTYRVARGRAAERATLLEQRAGAPIVGRYAAPVANQLAQAPARRTRAQTAGGLEQARRF
jgi:hypothetical protein